jgi:cupin superfamily acireductone dioxygenase involved in methionine salvage
MNTKQIIKSLKTITAELSKITSILEKTQVNKKPRIKKNKPEIIYHDDEFDEYINRIIRNGGL